MDITINKVGFWSGLIAFGGCGIILIVWLLVQLAIIGFVSWMQPVTAVAFILILFFTRQLPRYDH